MREAHEKHPKINPTELTSWIIEEDADYIVIDKPGWVVCHPSKDGPWSSLVGAIREMRGGKVHLVSRLDRETSGVLLLAKHEAAASAAQVALEKREVEKTYLTLLEGELNQTTVVDQPLGPDAASRIAVKTTVLAGGSPSTTHFEPLKCAAGYTLARVQLPTGRKHQIRAHALWLGHPVVGDKLYGRDESLYLELVEKGWTDRHEQSLALPRQALHAARLEFKPPRLVRTFIAPLAADMRAFINQQMGVSAEDLTTLLAAQGLR